MFESFGFETLTAPQAAVWFALALGALFGLLAERTRFCLRRGLVAGPDRRQALGVWLMALAVAVAGTQAAVATGWISFDAHRFFDAEMPVVAIALGGALFGAGMVLARGCASRLTVLAATGNLRALTVLLVFAVTAGALSRGALAPLRQALGGLTLDPGAVSLAALPGGAMLWSVVLAGGALLVALRSGNSLRALAGGAAIGALVPLGWVGTGFVLYDDFDPIALQSLAFTGPWADSLFWSVAASAIPAGFGTGLVGGVLAGSFLSALAAGRLGWQSFGSVPETGRYLGGAVLMGAGGVLAGGCTVGAGLSGVPTLSLAAILALAAIVAGARATDALLMRTPRGAAAPALVPAE